MPDGLRVVRPVVLAQRGLEVGIANRRDGQDRLILVILASLPEVPNTEMTGPTIWALPASHPATARRARLLADSRSGVAVVTRSRLFAMGGSLPALIQAVSAWSNTYTTSVGYSLSVLPSGW